MDIYKKNQGGGGGGGGRLDKMTKTWNNAKTENAFQTHKYSNELDIHPKPPKFRKAE